MKVLIVFRVSNLCGTQAAKVGANLDVADGIPVVGSFGNDGDLLVNLLHNSSQSIFLIDCLQGERNCRRNELG